MDRKDDRNMPRQHLQRLEEIRQGPRIIHVGRAVQREHGVAGPRIEAEALRDRRALPAVPRALERVDHDVADEVNLLGAHALAQEVVASALLCHEEEIGDGVGQHPIDLFGHRAIEAPKSGFHVGDRDRSLDRGDGCRQGGVHVADHEHDVGPDLFEDRIQTLHHVSRLDRVSPRTDLEIEVRRMDLQIPEEALGHRGVVVLAGVHERRGERRPTRHLPNERRDLHEVGARADDAEDVHGDR